MLKPETMILVLGQCKDVKLITLLQMTHDTQKTIN